MDARSQVRRVAVEAARFLAVGGVATLVALVLFNLLVHGLHVGEPLLADRPLTAYVVANAVGMVVSYHGSRHYAFRDRPARSADGGLAAYVAINLATMTIPVACLALSRDVLGLDDPLSDNLAANIVGALLGLVARFHLFRTYVFRRPIALVELYDEPLSADPVAPTGPSTSDRAIPPAA